MRSVSTPLFLRFLAAGLAALAFGGPVLPAGAVEARAVLRIRVVVEPYARLRVSSPRFVVTEQDIARGYVDVEAPVVVAVLSNVAGGYTLLFAPQGDQVEAAMVDGPGLQLHVPQGGAQASRPAPGRGVWKETLQLRFRLVLAPTARAGEHRWPVAISMA